MNIDNSNQPFGRLAKETKSPIELINLEKQHDKSGQFDNVDALISNILIRALRSEQIAELLIDRVQKSLLPHGFSQSYQEIMDAVYSVNEQQAHGAWYLPNDVSLRVGLCQLPLHFRNYPRFA